MHKCSFYLSCVSLHQPAVLWSHERSTFEAQEQRQLDFGEALSLEDQIKTKKAENPMCNLPHYKMFEGTV